MTGGKSIHVFIRKYFTGGNLGIRIQFTVNLSIPARDAFLEVT